MRPILKVLKGLLIGISVVIPGVSGGTMAVSMGIYDQLIDFITVSGSTKKRLAALLPYIVGILLGVAIFSFFIEAMFTDYPLQTAFLFTGLILGALPMLIGKVKHERFRTSHGVILASMTALMVLLPISSHNTGAPLTLDASPIHALLCLILGLIGAATMVIPGVSGSMLLMLLGYYEPILQNVNNFTAAVLRLDFSAMLTACVVLIPFSLGMLVGLVVMARLIRVLLTHLPYATYYAILGLVVASPFAVLYQRDFSDGTVFGYIVCAIMAIVGFLAAYTLSRGE